MGSLPVGADKPIVTPVAVGVPVFAVNHQQKIGKSEISWAESDARPV